MCYDKGFIISLLGSLSDVCVFHHARYCLFFSFTKKETDGRRNIVGEKSFICRYCLKFTYYLVRLYRIVCFSFWTQLKWKRDTEGVKVYFLPVGIILKINSLSSG